MPNIYGMCSWEICIGFKKRHTTEKKTYIYVKDTYTYEREQCSSPLLCVPLTYITLGSDFFFIFFPLNPMLHIASMCGRRVPVTYMHVILFYIHR